MSTEPYDRAMDARAEAEAQVLQGQKAPMHMTYAEKVKAGLGLPPPLERLENDVTLLWADVNHAEQFGMPCQQDALRNAVLELAESITAIIAHWRAEEIKRLEAEK